MDVSKISDLAIAHAMCDASVDILWKHIEPWAKKKKLNIELRCRVGSGKRTYHRKLSANVHLLNYGIKMVGNKRLNPASASRWTTGREILKRGYFDSSLTLSNIISHTVVHEFSHLIQVLNGWRYDGSVHNEDFYNVVDRIYLSGKADEVKYYLLDRCGRFDLDDRWNELANQISEENLESNQLLPRGQSILFLHNGCQKKAIITRVNKHTYSIQGDSFKGRLPLNYDVTPV
jgi:hypothetical protein